MSKRILILNGPNLNMLGRREPHIYGATTLLEVEAMCTEAAEKLGLAIRFRQSNHEGELVDWIQAALDDETAGVIINAAAYTHTSVAIHDALKLLSCPIIEVHISDPETREEFRHFSYVRPVAAEVIKGNGVAGYTQAVEAIARLL
jgi:3-dehydroquinate dehydratase-2